jgi:predicted O-linked N-acetylglucosamine transferase (SPINDLY family)
MKPGKTAPIPQTQPPTAEVGALLELYNARRYAEAESRVRALLGKYPDFGFGWQLLGGALQMQGKDALSAFQKCAQLQPGNAEAQYNLGIAFKNAGQLENAVASYRRAVELKPGFSEAHTNLGNTLKDLGRFGEAVAGYRCAIGIKPDSADAHNNLGAALKGMGEFDEAVACYRRAVAIRPDYTDAHYNLGNILKELGRVDEAAGSYRRAIELKPDFALAHNNLGVALEELGQLNHAEECYRRTLESAPYFAEAHCNLGVVLDKLGRLDEAEASFLRAIGIKPEFPGALINLGNVCRETGRIDEAIAYYRRAVALDPNDTTAHSNLIYTLSFHPDFDDEKILAEAKIIASSFNPSPLPAGSYTGRNAASGRRLRIGYVSPDFRDHCQSFFTVPLLSNHDHAQFEIHCYADLKQPDDISKRLRGYSDAWRDIHLKSDRQAAEIISGDGIDILVDLTMHMANGRPKLFALKPAPLQVAWLAYPGTTGIAAIDYRFTDPWLDPPGPGDDHYTEKSIRLPDTFWCYDPLISGLQPNDLPALKAGCITFGCLNSFSKVSDDTLCRWGQVMARMPSSRLILLTPAGRHRLRIFELLGRHGIAAERIELMERQPRLQYLQTYHRIDICLDTLPANGHTTSLDAYWMGVPVITRVGHTVIGRGGWSQLNNLGLTELAAFDDRTFIDMAIALATDLARLSRLRQTLRGKLETSPLMDGKRFARAIETAYRRIWQGIR